MSEDPNKEIKDPPVEENKTDFPPLPIRVQPQTLAVKVDSTMVPNKVGEANCLQQDTFKKKEILGRDSLCLCKAVSPNKRKMGASKRFKEGTFTQYDNDTFIGVSSKYPSGSPMKKSKKMCYREPTLLKSLDSEVFNFLSSGSSSLGDSFPSDGESSSPIISPSTSIPVYKNNNLESLTEFIQQYSGTTLDSFTLPADDKLSPEVTNAKPLPRVISPLALPSSSTEALLPVKSEPSQPLRSSVQYERDHHNNLANNQDLSSYSTCAIQTNYKEKIIAQTSSDLQTFSLADHSKCLSENSIKYPNKNKSMDSGMYDSVFDNWRLTSGGELYEGGAPGDLKSWSCKKNPGHHLFHLPSELKVKDLPRDIQHEDCLTFFNCLSQLVVRITVERTSDKRSPDDMYSKYIGTYSRRNGSGFIGSVDEELLKFKCKKEDCCGSDDPDFKINRSFSFEDHAGLISTPHVDRTLSNTSTASSSSSNSSSDSCSSHYLYGGVYVNTNKHVIFDKSEAEFARVHFFYNTPDKKGVIYGHVASLIGVSPNQDRVTLHVLSHDRKLFNLINLHLKNAKSSYTQMVRSTHMSQQVHGYGKEHSWAVIISHPHGLAKTITCGRVRRETSEAKYVVKYYDSATCPGSSGGLLITPSLLQLQWPGAVHSCTDIASGFNVSFDSRVPDLDVKLISDIHKPLLNRKESFSDNIFSL